MRRVITPHHHFFINVETCIPFMDKYVIVAYPDHALFWNMLYPTYRRDHGKVNSPMQDSILPDGLESCTLGIKRQKFILLDSFPVP